jgi:hypothetical protein
MSEDEALAKVATGLAADHQEKKRKGRGKADTEAAIGEAAAGQDAAENLGGEDADEADIVGDEAEIPEAPTAIDHAVDRLTNLAMDAHFETGSLVGDVRDTLLDLYRANPKPWSQLLEADQRNIASALEHVAQVMVRKIVLIVAEDDAAGRTVHAKLESYAEKGGFRIALTASSDSETALALHEAVGHEVILKRADMNHYNGQRGDPPINPDQPDLLFEGEEGERPAAPPIDDSDLAGAGMGFDDQENEVDTNLNPFPEPGIEDA